MAWVMTKPGVPTEYILFQPPQQHAFNTLGAMREFQQGFASPEEASSGRFTWGWFGRWNSGVISFAQEAPQGAVDVTVVFLAHFLEQRLQSMAQPRALCPMIDCTAAHTEATAKQAMENTFTQAAELLDKL